MSKRLAIKNGVLVTVDNDAVKKVFDVNNSSDTAVFDDVDTAKKVPNGATLFIQNQESEAYKNSPAGLRYAVDHIVMNSSASIEHAEDNDEYTKHAPSLLAVKDYVNNKLSDTTTTVNESIDQITGRIIQLEENNNSSKSIQNEKFQDGVHWKDSSVPSGIKVDGYSGIVTKSGAILLSENSFNKSAPITVSILRSTDCGKTWEACVTKSAGPTEYLLYYTSNNTVIAVARTAWKSSTDNVAILRSVDDGITWQTISIPENCTRNMPSGDPYFSCNAIIETNEHVLNILTGTGVMYSADDGVTWHASDLMDRHDPGVGRDIAGEEVFNIAHNKKTNVLIVIGRHWEHSSGDVHSGIDYVYTSWMKKSADNGATWTDVDTMHKLRNIEETFSGSGFYLTALPDGSFLLRVSSGGNQTKGMSLWRSTNDGLSWEQSTVTVASNVSLSYLKYNIEAINILPDGKLFSLSTIDYYYWCSTDNGITWTQYVYSESSLPRYTKSGNATLKYNKVYTLRDGTLLFIGQSICYSTDGGLTWHASDVYNNVRFSSSQGLLAYNFDTIVEANDGTVITINTSSDIEQGILYSEPVNFMSWVKKITA